MGIRLVGLLNRSFQCLFDIIDNCYAAPKSSVPRRVSPVIAYYLQRNKSAFDELSAMIEETDNPDLGQTLETIARGGRDAFYSGDLARTMDAYFKRIGGDMRYADFATHHGNWVTPGRVNYRGYDLYELPPNGQGLLSDDYFGGYQAIAIDHEKGSYSGATEMRKDGTVAAY